MNEFRWYSPNYTLPVCQSPSEPCAPTAWWFWLTAAVVVAFAGGKK